MAITRGTRPLLVGALSLALAGCGSDDTRLQQAQEEGADAVAAILGEPVTVEAEVSDVLGPNSFTVGASDTLVLGEVVPEVQVGDRVVARGTVRQLVVPDFDDEFDWISTGTRPWPDEYVEDLVLVADSVRLAEPAAERG